MNRLTITCPEAHIPDADRTGGPAQAKVIIWGLSDENEDSPVLDTEHIHALFHPNPSMLWSYRVSDQSNQSKPKEPNNGTIKRTTTY